MSFRTISAHRFNEIQIHDSLRYFRTSVLWRSSSIHVAFINVLSILIGFMCQGSLSMKWNYVSALKSSRASVSHRQFIFLMENVLELFSRVKKNENGNSSRIWCVYMFVWHAHVNHESVVLHIWGGGGDWTFFIPCVPATMSWLQHDWLVMCEISAN